MTTINCDAFQSPPNLPPRDLCSRKEMDLLSKEDFEKVIYAKILKLCRGCLTESSSKSMLRLFSSDHKIPNRGYNEMVTSCTGIHITEDDGLPQCLCISCANEILNFYEFRNKCLSIDTSLRKLLGDCNANSLDELDALILYTGNDNKLLINDIGNFTNTSETVVKKESFSKNKFISKKRKSIIKTSIEELNTENLTNTNTRVVNRNRSNSKKRFISIKRKTPNKTLKKKLQTGKPSLVTQGEESYNSDDSMGKGLSDFDPLQSMLKDDEDNLTSDPPKKTKRHAAAIPFPCRKCELHFLSWQELSYHNNQHPPITQEQKLSCRYCKEMFCHERHIVPHFKVAHKEIPRFQCGYCGEKWKEFKYLKEHLITHSPGDPVIDVLYDENDIFSRQRDVENEEIQIDIEIPLLTDHFKSEGSYPSNINLKMESDVTACGEMESHINAHNPSSNVADTLICYTCKQLFIDKETLECHLVQDHRSENINIRNIRPSGENPNTNETAGIENEKQDFIKEECKDSTDISVSIEIPSFNSDYDIGKQSDGTLINKKNTPLKILRHEDINDFKPIKKTKKKVSKTKLICTDGDEKGQHYCNMCGKDFKALSDLKRHESSHDPDKPFYCRIGRCKWSFATEYDLEIHVNVNHREAGDHECNFCHKVFPHRRNLRQHMLQHRSTKRFTCTYCDKGFTHMHHFKNHVRLHTKELPFLCQVCGTTFPTKDRLKSHANRHSDVRPFSCEQCNKTFVTVSDLKYHTQRHSGERLHMCSTCGKTYTARSQLNNHVRLVHPEFDLKDSQDPALSTAVECKICGVIMPVVELNQHMKIHTCQYFCTLCPKSFPLTSALEAHIKTHSVGNRSQVCGKCGAAFNRASHLHGHTVRCHRVAVTLPCPHCSSTFTNKPDLKSHIRTHTGERPYVCKECNKAFTQSHTLRVHMRTHTGEQPYICGSCHKAHRSASALSHHMRTHSKILTGKQAYKMKSKLITPFDKTSPRNVINSVMEDLPAMISSLEKNPTATRLDQQLTYTVVESTSSCTEDVTLCIGKDITIDMEELGAVNHEIVISHKEEIIYD